MTEANITEEEWIANLASGAEGEFPLDAEFQEGWWCGDSKRERPEFTWATRDPMNRAQVYFWNGGVMNTTMKEYQEGRTRARQVAAGI